MPLVVILAILSNHMAILDIRKLDAALLALKIDTMIRMQNLVQVPGRLVYSLDSEAILVDANTPYVGIYV